MEKNSPTGQSETRIRVRLVSFLLTANTIGDYDINQIGAAFSCL